MTQPEQGRTASPSIQFIDVSKHFGTKRAVDQVSYTVSPGSTSVVIGPSGSGKSTLLRLVNLLERPSSGSLLIGDQDILQPGFDVDSLRKQIGMVFQHFNLFPHLSVIENVAFALREVHQYSKDAAYEIAESKLDRVGLKHLRDRSITRISGGERQRASIARALAINPAILLFDEVTSALDPQLVKEVLVLMSELAREGITTLVVTHEMRFARLSADDVLFMQDGRVVEQGPPEQLFEQPSTQELREFLDLVD